MPELLKALLVSASLGALLGLERQWSEARENPAAEGVAGARTFALWAAIGALCAWFSREQHPAFFLAGFAGMIAILAVFIYRRAGAAETPGLTTAAVALTTYLLGGLVFLGQAKAAVVMTVSLLLLLAAKEQLHRLSSRFSAMDVYLALQFLAVTGIVLPLVPDHPFGPYGAFNPHTIWMMVVLVGGIGFAGYVAMRIFGENRGIPFAGLLGGLASSTATTLAMSRLSRVSPGSGRMCALAVALACTVMLVRVAVIVGALSRPTLWALLPKLMLVALPAAVFAAWSWRHLRGGGAEGAPAHEVRNPLSLAVAIQFAILYALVVLVVRWADDTFGGTGVYWASAIAGLTDLDAISISIAQLQQSDHISPEGAARAVLIAAGTNSLLKAGMATVLGGATMRGPVLAVMGATVALIALAAWLM